MKILRHLRNSQFELLESDESVMAQVKLVHKRPYAAVHSEVGAGERSTTGGMPASLSMQHLNIDIELERFSRTRIHCNSKIQAQSTFTTSAIRNLLVQYHNGAGVQRLSSPQHYR